MKTSDILVIYIYSANQKYYTPSSWSKNAMHTPNKITGKKGLRNICTAKDGTAIISRLKQILMLGYVEEVTKALKLHVFLMTAQ